MDRQLRIVYMGTPDFALEPLRAILNEGYKVEAVVTMPDKPAGRGQKIRFSPVKEFAEQNNLLVLQPENLKDPLFFEELKRLHADLQVVVAFRMLPTQIWQMPEYGTLNLHASLLPQYRGAAPINHAIMNGETETGITTFFIEKEIDTGKIILAERYPIYPTDDAGTLHDRLKEAGAQLILKTLRLIETNQVKEVFQQQLITENTILKPASKIFQSHCEIHWDSPCTTIHNLVRGLSPHPGAFSILSSKGSDKKKVKIFRTAFFQEPITAKPGTILLNDRKTLSVAASDGIIQILELQFEGKKRLSVTDFLNGNEIGSGSCFV